MTEWATRRAEGDETIDVEREWNPGGVGNQLGDERETSDASWNPGGDGNATEDEFRNDEDRTEAEAAGE